MFNDLLGSIVGGALIPGFSVSRDEMMNVRISIPRDHPKAERLLALAEELATRQVLPSGIVVDYSDKIQDDRLMSLLREIVDVDAIMLEAARRHREAMSLGIQQQAIAGLSDPQRAMQATAGLLRSAHEVLPLSAAEKDRLDNMLRERKVPS